jgi:hypothetical protein
LYQKKDWIAIPSPPGVLPQTTSSLRSLSLGCSAVSPSDSASAVPEDAFRWRKKLFISMEGVARKTEGRSRVDPEFNVSYLSPLFRCQVPSPRVTVVMINLNLVYELPRLLHWLSMPVFMRGRCSSLLGHWHYGKYSLE